MFDALKKLGGKVKEATAKAAVALGDLNGDGKVDEQDAKIAADWTRKQAGAAAEEVGRLSKAAMRTDLAKDAAAGAAIGAVVAIPLPIVGPIAGAAVGAGLGVYKNFTRKGAASTPGVPAQPIDTHSNLLKLADLRDKGILTEAEFVTQKQRVLKGED